MGLAETDFWEMTIAEVERYLRGAHWRYKTQAQYDYTLANLIGISVGRLIASDLSFPSIEEVYPNLYEKESQEIKEQKEEEEKMINSQNRFLEFAMKHNAKMKGVETKE